MKSSVDRVIKELELGYIPYELTFNLEPECKIDWTCLKYDDWNDVDFWIGKQPPGLLDEFPCLFSWVEQIAESRKNITPLMELEERKKNI